MVRRKKKQKRERKKAESTAERSSPSFHALKEQLRSAHERKPATSNPKPANKNRADTVNQDSIQMSEGEYFRAMVDRVRGVPSSSDLCRAEDEIFNDRVRCKIASEVKLTRADSSKRDKQRAEEKPQKLSELSPSSICLSEIQPPGPQWHDESMPVVSRRQVPTTEDSPESVRPMLNLRHLPRKQALPRLKDFVFQHQALGHDSVMVIVGKGIGSTGPAVLKQAVEEWCFTRGRRQVRELVLDCDPDGDYGRVILMLRRRNK